MIGTILDGRYRILGRLGAGGMGEVYLGEHLVLGRQEAIKILKAKLAKDERHLARFRREARATNRLQHENIVGFYDFGRLPDGRLYLTMEFADGPNLEAILREEGRFEVSRAVAILKQLAQAIDFAHSKDVIHRDLKPQNLVLVQAPGRPDMLKILDFGVAKITAPGYLESYAITKEGQVFGTPAYISPEQIRGVTDDPRSDIYALGCIAYELVTGETPFSGRPMAVLEAHMSDDPEAPSQRCLEAQIPRELDQIILRCLAKDPQERLQSGQMVFDLLAALRLDTARSLVPRFSGEVTMSGFGGDADATIEGVHEEIAALDDEVGTTDMYASRVDLELRKILRQLAESMCDLGCSDPALLVVLAEANQVEQDLASIRAELNELARSDSLVAQRARERQASLRFALGELKFGVSDSDAQSRSVEQAVKSLNKRLANLAEETRVQHATITEKQIDKTARRASCFEELHGFDEKLSHLIDRHAGRMRGHKHIAELLEARERVRQRLHQQQTSDPATNPLS